MDSLRFVFFTARDGDDRVVMVSAMARSRVGRGMGWVLGEITQRRRVAEVRRGFGALIYANLH